MIDRIAPIIGIIVLLVILSTPFVLAWHAGDGDEPRDINAICAEIFTVEAEIITNVARGDLFKTDVETLQHRLAGLYREYEDDAFYRHRHSYCK